MPRYSAPAGLGYGLPVGLGDGTNDESTAGGDQGDRDSVQAGEPGGEGRGSGRVVRDDGLASQPCSEGVGEGVGAQGRAAAAAAGSQVWAGRGGRVAVLLGGARCA